jgi:hypothetical protein
MCYSPYWLLPAFTPEKVNKRFRGWLSAASWAWFLRLDMSKGGRWCPVCVSLIHDQNSPCPRNGTSSSAPTIPLPSHLKIYLEACRENTPIIAAFVSSAARLIGIGANVPLDYYCQPHTLTLYCLTRLSILGTSGFRCHHSESYSYWNNSPIVLGAWSSFFSQIHEYDIFVVEATFPMPPLLCNMSISDIALLPAGSCIICYGMMHCSCPCCYNQICTRVLPLLSICFMWNTVLVSWTVVNRACLQQIPDANPYTNILRY